MMVPQKADGKVVFLGDKPHWSCGRRYFRLVHPSACQPLESPDLATGSNAAGRGIRLASACYVLVGNLTREKAQMKSYVRCKKYSFNTLPWFQNLYIHFKNCLLAKARKYSHEWHRLQTRQNFSEIKHIIYSETLTKFVDIKQASCKNGHRDG